MTNEQKIQDFVNDVYLIRYNRYVDDITDEDGQTEVAKTISWTNMLVGELERETDSNGQPMNWSFARENDKEIGVITIPGQSFTLPDGVMRLLTNDDRPLIITHDGSIVSSWEVVAANQISRRKYSPDNRVTVVNKKIIFSRPLRDFEIGGTVIADVINKLPRLSLTDTSLLDTVEPVELLMLGVAKNATLPDIVQGGLSPSFVQKYGDLLEQTKIENDTSSMSDEVTRDDYSDISGVY